MSDTRVKRPVTQLANLDLNLLVILRELLRERNVTRAAERVAITQPAASAALRRLRRHFGDDLLVRRRSDYVLSPLAVQLAQHVEQACAAAERVFSAESGFDPHSSDREFTLLMADYTIAVIGDPLSRLLARQAPGVRLHVRMVRETLAAEAGETIRHLDGLIAPPMTALMLPHVRSVELFRDRWVCVCWAGSRALSDGAPRLADLARLDWVAPYLPDRGHTSAAPLVAQLAMLGIQPHVSVRLESYAAVPYFLAGTDRVALMQERLARQMSGPLELRVVEFPRASAPIVEALWWCEDYDDDPAHRWLRQALALLAEQL